MSGHMTLMIVDDARHIKNVMFREYSINGLPGQTPIGILAIDLANPESEKTAIATFSVNRKILIDLSFTPSLDIYALKDIPAEIRYQAPNAGSYNAPGKSRHKKGKR